MPEPAPVGKLPEAGIAALEPPAKLHEAAGLSLYELGRLLATSALRASINGGEAADRRPLRGMCTG